MKSIRTPLAVVRGRGSAKTGTDHFIVQRVTSVALLILLTLFVIILVALNGEPYETVMAWLGSPYVAAILIAGILVTVVHMRVGNEVIIEDYVPGEWARIVAFLANWLICWGVGLVAVFAVLKIAFGGA